VGLVQTVLKWVASAAFVYVAVVALVAFAQERLIFLPEKLPQDWRFDFGRDVHEVWVEREAGVRLHALHMRLPKPDGVVFYLHGNAGNLQSWFVNPDFWRAQNLDLFMLDYRGYGKSGGRIGSEQQLMDDVRAAWAQVVPAYDGQRRVIFGRSIGTGLAAQLAAEAQPELTVLVSPYQSLAALAAEHYRWVPGFVLRYPLRTDEALARVRTPVLLVHGARDELIGEHHSAALRARAPNATLLNVPDAGHNDLQMSRTYLEGLGAALRGAR
jgi:hypothetical protein